MEQTDINLNKSESVSTTVESDVQSSTLPTDSTHSSSAINSSLLTLQYLINSQNNNVQNSINNTNITTDMINSTFMNFLQDQNNMIQNPSTQIQSKSINSNPQSSAPLQASMANIPYQVIAPSPIQQVSNNPLWNNYPRMNNQLYSMTPDNQALLNNIGLTSNVNTFNNARPNPTNVPPLLNNINNGIFTNSQQIQLSNMIQNLGKIDLKSSNLTNPMDNNHSKVFLTNSNGNSSLSSSSSNLSSNASLNNLTPSSSTSSLQQINNTQTSQQQQQQQTGNIQNPQLTCNFYILLYKQ